MPYWLPGLLLAVFGSFALATGPLSLQELGMPGRLLMLRHANAPGNGDPTNFQLHDCKTQRNLDDVGRAQARSLGSRLAKVGVKRARVYSSQWCRCLETARLLGLGPVEELPALNSFYPAPHEREAKVARLRAFLANQPTNGPLTVLVTHQFTIAELTGGGTPSGGGAVFQLDGRGSPRLIGSIVPE